MDSFRSFGCDQDLTAFRWDVQVVLNRHLDETLESAGLVCDDGLTRNSLIIGDLGRGPPSKAGREPVAGVDSLPALAAVAASKEAGAEAASPALLAGDFSPRINSFLAAKPAPSKCRLAGFVVEPTLGPSFVSK